MHPHQVGALQAAAQGLGFDSRQLLKPLHGDLATETLLAQHPVQAEVPRLTGEQLAVQRLKLRVRALPRLARSGVKAAIRATQGQVLAWQGKPIHAVYHASNGGVSANEDEAWCRLP